MGELVDVDQEHLRLLKLGFFILAALCGVMSMFLLMYAGVIGFVFAAAGGLKDGLQLPVWIIPLIGGALLLVGATATFLTWYTGRSLGERRRRTFCMIVAGLCCFQVPFGSLIGVCTLMVLSRPSVKELFEFAPHVMPPALPPAQPRL